MSGEEKMAAPMMSGGLEDREEEEVLDAILDAASLSHLSRPLKEAGETLDTLEAKLNEGGRSALLQHLKTIR